MIPARGGSKGIPRKNLEKIRGRSLIARTVGHALNAKRVTRVVVSTDDPEIAAEATAAGAEVIERPTELSGDEATSESAVLHVLEHLSSIEGYEPELVVFLQATSPIRGDDAIDDAVAVLEKENADSLFSACAPHGLGLLWERSGRGLRSVTYDYRDRTRRQGMEVVRVLETGSFWILKPWVLREFNNRLGGKITFFEMDPLHSFEIDDHEDLEFVRRLADLLED